MLKNKRISVITENAISSIQHVINNQKLVYKNKIISTTKHNDLKAEKIIKNIKDNENNS